MFIELHIIQNFPPSNLNRDDLGQPKDADFGGYRRARISSQCQKRAIRHHRAFAETTKVPLSSRTKLLAQELTKRLAGPEITEEQAKKAAILFAEAYSGKMDQKKKEETAVLLYLSASELTWVADQLKSKWEAVAKLLDEPQPKTNEESKSAKGKKGKGDKEPSTISDLVNELVKLTMERTSAPDIAMFGRMLADNPKTNIDAACQVAHAISTHAIDKMEMDYYTAMDELKDKRDPGAGFLDVAYFNSACFYRYARIDWAQLKASLRTEDLQGNGLTDLPSRTVEGFLRAAEAAIPSGKQNSHAQQCRPSFMLAVLREKESDGWSLVNAFEKPVNPRAEGDLIEASVRRLDRYFNHLCDFYGSETIKAMAVALPDGTVEPDLLSDSLRASVKKMNDWVATIVTPLGQGA